MTSTNLWSNVVYVRFFYMRRTRYKLKGESLAQSGYLAVLSFGLCAVLQVRVHMCAFLALQTSSHNTTKICIFKFTGQCIGYWAFFAITRLFHFLVFWGKGENVTWLDFNRGNFLRILQVEYTKHSFILAPRVLLHGRTIYYGIPKLTARATSTDQVTEDDTFVNITMTGSPRRGLCGKISLHKVIINKYKTLLILCMKMLMQSDVRYVFGKLSESLCTCIFMHLYQDLYV